MEASLVGVNSIGFSLLDYSFDADFSKCTPFLKSICRHVLDEGMQDAKLLNVNIPVGEIKGIKVCRQGEAKWVEEFQLGTDPRGKKYYWLTGRFENQDPLNDTDINALNDQYISVVPSKHDLTDYLALPSVKSLESITI